MIQRIQSIYLLLVSVLMSFMLIFPLEILQLSSGEIATVYSTGARIIEENSKFVIYSTYPVAILIVFVMIISFMNIFFYGNRIKQMRICVYTILLLVGLIIMMAFFYFLIRNNVDIFRHWFKFPAIMPVVSIILLFQAFRNIRKDEELVKSYDRIR